MRLGQHSTFRRWGFWLSAGSLYRNPSSPMTFLALFTVPMASCSRRVYQTMNNGGFGLRENYQINISGFTAF